MGRFEFQGIGTHWSIDIDENFNESLVDGITNIVSNFEKRYSRFLPDSEISLLNQQGKGEYKITDDLVEMLEFAQKLRDLSGGAFDPNIGHLLTGRGYDTDYSFKKNEDELNLNVENWKIKNRKLYKEGVSRLDLGALGKGYLIDKVADYLRESGHDKFLIDGGGDIFGTSKADNKAWVAAIEHPLENDMAIATVSLKNKALATSSPKYRRVGEFHHLLNVANKSSANQVLAVSVLADSALKADACATALFVTDRNMWRKISVEMKLEYLVINPDMSFESNSNIFEVFSS